MVELEREREQDRREIQRLRALASRHALDPSPEADPATLLRRVTLDLTGLPPTPAEVKAFLRAAFYRRFGIAPDPEFVEIHPGGGAVGVRVGRYDALPRLVERLRAGATS